MLNKKEKVLNYCTQDPSAAEYFHDYYTDMMNDIDPIVFDDKKNLYFITLYCYGNDELDSKMDMLKRFFENFYTRSKR